MLNALRKINRIMRAVAVAAGALIVIFKVIEGMKKTDEKEARSEVYNDIW